MAQTSTPPTLLYRLALNVFTAKLQGVGPRPEPRAQPRAQHLWQLGFRIMIFFNSCDVVQKGFGPFLEKQQILFIFPMGLLCHFPQNHPTPVWSSVQGIYVYQKPALSIGANLPRHLPQTIGRPLLICNRQTSPTQFAGHFFGATKRKLTTDPLETYTALDLGILGCTPLQEITVFPIKVFHGPGCTPEEEATQASSRSWLVFRGRGIFAIKASHPTVLLFWVYFLGWTKISAIKTGLFGRTTSPRRLCGSKFRWLALRQKASGTKQMHTFRPHSRRNHLALQIPSHPWVVPWCQGGCHVCRGVPARQRSRTLCWSCALHGHRSWSKLP